MLERVAARGEPDELLRLEALPHQHGFQFSGLDELVPHVEVRRQNARSLPILHDLDRKQFAKPRAIDGVENEKALGLQDPPDLGQHLLNGTYVLEHVEAVGRLEGGGPKRQGFARAAPIVDSNPYGLSVRTSYRDRTFGRINAGQTVPEPGHLFRDQAAAAPEIQDPHGVGRNLCALAEHAMDISDPRDGKGHEKRQEVGGIAPAVGLAIVDLVVNGASSQLSALCVLTTARIPWCGGPPGLPAAAC